MKTSKLSKETSSLLSKMSRATSPPPPSSPPQRRTTRSSLARFAYTESAPSTSTPNPPQLLLGPDIEDAITTRTTKRRRTTKPEASRSKTEESDATPPDTASKPRKTRLPARVIKGSSPSHETVEPPTDWEETYELVKQMRLSGPARDAAVDTMGCERLFHPEASPRDRRFHILIALMLSSQTKDTVNAVAMRRLMTELPPHEPGAAPGLNLENVLAVEPELLNELIWAVGFHNNKTKYIKAAALILRDKFDGDIPDTIQGLTSLPGVGPKMAYLCLSAAWDRTEGIGVDVHVHRITNLWGWHKTTQPEATRLALQAWLPRDKWREINWLLVGFGQTVCLPVGRRCGDCELGLRGMCRPAERKKVNEGRRAREVKVEVKEDAGGDVVIKTEEIIEEVNVEAEKVINEEVKTESPAESQQQPQVEDRPNTVQDAPRRTRRARAV
ncbi:Endonuclease III-like protein [Colletotrichum chlorophyti]|uniref:Endonuclease III homolog n=1 Tax=Colletotrichum chlorophyti TaxID=708187 RepID=A0A1Q8RQ16_9PEZI|nr:Endonuclease III-like protein [Colletotrichum chlorophyti]